MLLRFLERCLYSVFTINGRPSIAIVVQYILRRPYHKFIEYSNCPTALAIKCESVKISQIIQYSRLGFDPYHKFFSEVHNLKQLTERKCFYLT